MSALFWSSLNGFLAVAIGAFGAHGLKNSLDSYGMELFKTANHYQFIHALVMLVLSLLKQNQHNRSIMFFGVGTLIFSGSLYALALTKLKFLGSITPLGGICFLIGWALLMKAGLKR
jgi:uncharacterized membrane protein YgdD (TMEM256/DUF423 family)